MITLEAAALSGTAVAFGIALGLVFGSVGSQSLVGAMTDGFVWGVPWGILAVSQWRACAGARLRAAAGPTGDPGQPDRGAARAVSSYGRAVDLTDADAARGRVVRADVPGPRRSPRVVRPVRRRARPPSIDAALLRRAASHVPVPRSSTSAGSPRDVVRGGRSGRPLVSTLDHEDWLVSARTWAGSSALASVDLPTPGLFVDADLTVEPFAGTLPEWVTSHALELDGPLDAGGGGGSPAR